MLSRKIKEIVSVKPFVEHFHCIKSLFLLKIYVENVDFVKKDFIFGAKCGIVNCISVKDICLMSSE